MSSSFLVEKLKSEGILLAVVPFVASLAAFVFEGGYLIYFGVPLELVEVSPYKILGAMLWLVFVSAFFWAVGIRIFAVFTTDEPAVRRGGYILFGGPLVVWLAWKVWNQPTLAAAFTWPVIGLLGYGFYRLFGEKGALSERAPEISKAYQAAQKRAEEVEPYELAYVGPICVLFMLLLLVGTLGYWVAKLDRTRWVLAEQPNYLLVRKYGETFLFKEYDPATKRLLDKLKVLHVGESGTLSLEKKVIDELHGPLDGGSSSTHTVKAPVK